MGTSVFYVDYHPDLRVEEIRLRSYGKVYPNYKVDGLKIARVKIPGMDITEEDKEFRANVILKAYPVEWRERLLETYEGGCLMDRYDKNIVFSSPFDVSKLKKTLEDDVVQYHVDPDAFQRPYLKRNFGDRNGKKTVCSRYGNESLPSHLRFSRLLGTQFLGVFEWYLKNMDGEEAYELLSNLKTEAMPDARYVVLPRYIAEHLPSKGRMGGSEILALDIRDGYDKLITSRIEFSSFGPVELEGKPFDINTLLKDGKVFFASETHADALLFFDSKPYEFS